MLLATERIEIHEEPVGPSVPDDAHRTLNERRILAMRPDVAIRSTRGRSIRRAGAETGRRRLGGLQDAAMDRGVGAFAS